MSTQWWFLSAKERGNPSSAIDRRRGDGLGWTEGNVVTPLIHGATYFARLHEELSLLGRGDEVWFLDWRGVKNVARVLFVILASPIAAGLLLWWRRVRGKRS